VPEAAINGLLKRVCYPTKGCNEFQYEGNNYAQSVTVYPNEGSKHIDLYAISELVLGSRPQRIEDIGQTDKITHDQMVDFVINVGLPYYDTQSICENPPSHTAKATFTISDEEENDIPIMIQTVSGLLVVEWNSILVTNDS